MLSIIPVMFLVVPESSFAARSLALPRSDYPGNAQIVALPATNEQADRLLGPAHRSSFGRLHRVDGLGWLQAAIWQFKTGRGRETQQHQTLFGYGINVYHNAAQARRALSDVKIKAKQYRVAHLAALMYRSSDVRETLYFVFFAYKSVEVEEYLEYTGVASAKLSTSLHHVFSRQSSHLAHLARVLGASLNQAPLPTPTSSPSPTLSPTATVTPTVAIRPSPAATAVPTETSMPTATAAPPTATPGPTATPVPAGFVVNAQLASPSVKPGDQATVRVQVTMNGQPVSGATLSASFGFPKDPKTCVGQTDKSGAASCSVVVPALPDGVQVQVSVQAVGANGNNAADLLTLTIHSGGTG